MINYYYKGDEITLKNHNNIRNDIGKYDDNKIVFPDKISGHSNNPSVFVSGIIYSIVVFLFLFIGSIVQSKEFYSGIIITEIVLILLPAILLLKVFKCNIKSTLRLNKINLFNLFLIFCIMIFSLPIVGIFNIINVWLSQLVFGKSLIVQPPTATTLKEVILNVLVIGLIAGISEEVLFRGAIQKGLENLGISASIIFTAVLFSMMHVQFEKLFGTFILGALIGFIVYRTDSLYSGIFAHFSNNTIGVVAMYAVNKISGISDETLISKDIEIVEIESIFDMFEGMPKGEIIASIIVGLIVLIISILVFTALLYTLIKNTKEIVEKKVEIECVKSANINKWEFLTFVPGLVLIILIFCIQAVELKNFNIQSSSAVLNFTLLIQSIF